MQPEYYKTVKQQGAKEIVIKKSRFIGHISPANSEEEAIDFINTIRKQHYSATHNCYAYIVGVQEQYQKYSDDGEPSGTAGKPILEVMKNHELTNTVIVVTRYFGGVMLGAGGLIRAYTDGAVAAVEAGQPVFQVLHRVVRVELDYTWLGKVENALHHHNMLTDELIYSDKVIIPCLPLVSETDSFIEWITELTEGQGKIELGETKYVAHDRFELKS